ncbi:hypothetical protein HanIR_Chr03g0123011 [Helianthus annuus]|nr:hypothetical protein HanIR_Chr03g0123011 [Helianthus annuus]
MIIQVFFTSRYVHAILGANSGDNETNIWNTYQLLTGQGKCFLHLIVVCRNIGLLFAGSCTCIRRTSCGLMWNLYENIKV